MADTLLVRPRTGIILPSIPRTGAHIPRALAEEWIADHLVVRMSLPEPPIVQSAPTGPGITRPQKQRSK